MRRGVLLLLAGLAGAAHAYDSKCFVGTTETPCSAGPGSARGRWLQAFGPVAERLDEHRQIWELTRELAGLPASASEAFALRVFADDVDVEVDGVPAPSAIPVDFRDAARVVDRGPRTPGEFTQLPDFGYSLFDWARGHETCPLDDEGLGPNTDPAVCHSFETHMGPVNSSHFPPQSRDFYHHYHQLALGRARHCDDVARRAGGQRARFAEHLRACERQALVLEAIAHHFLQDAWSMGHMWERWGSPRVPDFLADRKAAIAVGAFSGMIHGARTALQSLLAYAFADVNDPMCAPHENVRWRRPEDAGVTPAIGDEYLSLLTPAGAFADQYRELFSCTASSLLEVYEALASPALGPATGMTAGLRRVDPLDTCFSQRATNLALWQGAALDFTTKTGEARRVPLDVELVSKTLPTVASVLAPPPCTPDLAADPVCGPFLAQFRLDTMAVTARIALFGVLDPLGIQAASGGLPHLAGLAPNGAYAGVQPPAGYVDPLLPWPSRDEPDTRALDLARTFHRAHAGDWCETTSGIYLEGLKAHVLDATRSGAPPDEIDAATEACTELAARHTRTFTTGGPRADGEPLCTFAADDPERVAYLDRLAPTGTAEQAAASWCTCGNERLDPGEACDPTAADGDAACPGRCLAPRHLRPVGSTCVLDECTCGASEETPSCGGILFIRKPVCSVGCAAGGDIWLRTNEGSEERLTNHTTSVILGPPAWSPNRQRMAYRYTEVGDAARKIHVVVYNVSQRRSEGVVAVLNTALDPTFWLSAPTWSPDGTTLAVHAQFGIHTIDLANGNFMTWLAAPQHYLAPDWSPDGQEIAVVAPTGLGIMPATGGTAVVVTPLTHGGYPRWSPDGQQLVHAGALLGAQGLVTVYDRVTKAATTIGPGGALGATFSPDGRRIVFTRVTYDDQLPLGIQRDDSLWVIDVDGGNLEQLTFTTTKPTDAHAIGELAPDW